jgi:hypothetical protein
MSRWQQRSREFPKKYRFSVLKHNGHGPVSEVAERPFPDTFMKPALGCIEKLRDTLQWNPEPGRPVVEFIS